LDRPTALVAILTCHEEGSYFIIIWLVEIGPLEREEILRHPNMTFVTGSIKRSESSFILPIDIESRITAQ